MRNILLSLILLLLGVEAVGQTGPLDTTMVLVARFQSFSVVDDSTFSGSAVVPYDQLGQNFNPTQVNVGDYVVDNIGKLFEISSISAATGGSITFQCVERQDLNIPPIGIGVIVRADGSGIFGIGVNNNSGISDQVLGRLLNNNFLNVKRVLADTAAALRALTPPTSGAVGPGSSTDEAIVRFDGVSGDTLQNSTVTISDAGAMTMNGGNIALNGEYLSGDGDDEGIRVDGSSNVFFNTEAILDTNNVLNLFGPSVNSTNSGAIRFGEELASSRRYWGAYMKYDGVSNAMTLGTHPTEDFDSANDIDILYINRNGSLSIGDSQSGSGVTDAQFIMKPDDNFANFMRFVGSDNGTVFHMDSLARVRTKLQVLGGGGSPGEVVIGTTSGATEFNSKLSLFENMDANGDGLGGYIRYDGQNNKMHIGRAPSTGLQTDVITIPRTSTRVGIANTSPAYPLDVTGAIAATGIVYAEAGEIGLDATAAVKIKTGAGSPESVVSASPGSTYHDTTNGVIYVKETGTGSTGWVKSSSSVTGAASSTDNAIVRFSGVSGDTLQNSNITISDDDNINLPNTTFADQSGIIQKGGSRFLYDFIYGDNGTVTTTGYNLFLGENAGNFTMGSTATAANQAGKNTGLGYNALTNNTIGGSNVAIGYNALTSNTTGDLNMALGTEALSSNTTGGSNVAIGFGAVSSNTTGSNNVGMGRDALKNNTTGSGNVAAGYLSLNANTTAPNNTAIGNQALNTLATSGSNVAIGYRAGRYISGGSVSLTEAIRSTFIGTETKALADAGANEIVIGYDVTGNGSNTVTIGNSSITDNFFTGELGIGVTPIVSLDASGDAQIRGGTIGLDATSAVKIETGSGSPESVVSASPGSTYHDTTNGVIYVKETGTGSTGWVTSLSGASGTSDTEVLYNSGGVISGSSGMTYDGTELYISATTPNTPSVTIERLGNSGVASIDLKNASNHWFFYANGDDFGIEPQTLDGDFYIRNLANSRLFSVDTGTGITKIESGGYLRLTGQNGTATTLAGLDGSFDMNSVSIGAGLTLSGGTLTSDGSVGAASSTDNAIVRFDGVSGDTLQNSAVTISDAGAMTLNGGNIALNGEYLSGDGDDEGVFVASGGYVGINKSPTVPLHIYYPSGNPNVALERSAGQYFEFLVGGGSNNFYSSNGQAFSIRESDVSRNIGGAAASSTVRLYIEDGTGYVGLGVNNTAPEHELDVTGDISATGALITDGGEIQLDGSDLVRIQTGSGSPESVVSASIGSTYHDTTNGVIYVKETGTGSTGWVKSSSSVTGAASSTDNAIVRFDGTSGDTLQNSGITIDDSDNIDLPNTTFAAQSGIITKNGSRFLHDFEYGNNGTVTPIGDNLFIGEDAGNFTMGGTATSTQESTYNLGIGHLAGNSLTTGYRNVLLGVSSGEQITIGDNNMFIGYFSGRKNNASNNVAIGSLSFFLNTSSSNSVFMGTSSGSSLLSGDDNIGIGYEAMKSSTSTTANTAIGTEALKPVEGNYNVAIGYRSGLALTSGSENTLIGASSGNSYTTNSQGIVIGRQAEFSANGTSNETVIGYAATGQGSNTTTIGNASTTQTYLEGVLTLPDGEIEMDATGLVRIQTGTGSPESVVSASPGSTYHDTTNGVIYVKETGTGSTGWIGLITNPLSANLETNGNWISGDGDNEGVYVTSTGSVGVNLSAGISAKLHTYATSGSASFMAETETATTAGSSNIAGIKSTSTGVMADGFGTGIAFYVEDTDAVQNQLAGITAIRSGADNTGDMRITTYAAGSPVSTAQFKSDGGVRLYEYGEGDKTGAALSTEWGVPYLDANGNAYRMEVSNIMARMATASATITAATPESIGGDTAPSTVTDLSSTSDWSISNDSITYTGTETRFFSIIATVDGDATASGDYTFSIAKNGTVQSASAITGSIINANDKLDVTLIYALSLTTNDVIQFFVDVDAGTPTYNLDNLIVKIEAFDN